MRLYPQTLLKKKLRTVFHAYPTLIHKETKKKLIFYFDVTLIFPPYFFQNKL